MKVFINNKIPDIGIDMLEKAGIEIFIPKHEALSKDEWIQYCKESDAVLNAGYTFPYDKDFFNKCPNIKTIALYSVGFDHVDITEANLRNIPIGNTPDVLSKATSDIAFLLMQSAARQASYNFDKVKNGNW